MSTRIVLRTGHWNLLYNSIFKLEFTNHTNVIAFADDLIILTKGESIIEAENYMNLVLRKISDWARNNKLNFKREQIKSNAHVTQEKKGRQESRNILKQ
jgi:hypothetical protein